MEYLAPAQVLDTINFRNLTPFIVHLALLHLSLETEGIPAIPTLGTPSRCLQQQRKEVTVTWHF